MSTPSLIELRAGSVLAGYRVESVVARGGMGVVYTARELVNDRVVALKVLLPELSDDARFRERFERESRIAMSLEHPHVVPVYATGETEGVLYIAMRFVHGVDLRHLIRDVGALPPDRAVAIAEQTGSGLDAAHTLGLVHRDVKPANVMVESLGDHDHCYVMDFGLAKQAGSTGFTQTGNWVGTLDYVAPEQILGSDVDARTDVYALGALLFNALTGQPPFPTGHDAAKLHAHLHSPAPTVRSVRPDLAPEFDAVVGRALAKAPEDRYPSAGDLGRAARAALTGGVPTAPERSVATGEAALVANAARPNLASGQLTQVDATVGDSLAETGEKRRRLWPALAVIVAVSAIAAGVVAVIHTSGRAPQQRVANVPPATHHTKPQPKPQHRVDQQAPSVPPPDIARMLPANFRAVQIWHASLTKAPVQDVIVSSVGLAEKIGGHPADLQVFSWDPIARTWDVTFDAQKITSADVIGDPAASDRGIVPLPTSTSKPLPLLDPAASGQVTKVRFVQFRPHVGTDLVYSSVETYGGSGEPTSLVAVSFANGGASRVEYQWSGDQGVQFTVEGSPPDQTLVATASYWSAGDAHCCPIRSYSFTVGPMRNDPTALTDVADQRPWLGVSVTPVNLSDPHAGLRVTQVWSGSPADGALQQGDILLGVQNAPVPKSPALGSPIYDELASLNAGATASLVVSRSGNTITVPVRLSSLIASAAGNVIAPSDYNVEEI